LLKNTSLASLATTAL